MGFKYVTKAQARVFKQKSPITVKIMLDDKPNEEVVP
jgi:hypothetical protein